MKRVLFCSGKVFYDLLAGRTERGLTDTAIIRLEQLYPLPVAEVKAQLARYPRRRGRRLGAGGAGQPGGVDVHRDEPAPRAGRRDRVRPVSRPPAAAPAVGSTKLHDAEQAKLIEDALTRP